MQHSPIQRRLTRKIRVGSVYVGGDAPITVQTMTNTDTCDVAATVAQIQRCVNAGADIVRVSVPSMEAAVAFGQIRQQVNVPLVADIHFDQIRKPVLWRKFFQIDRGSNPDRQSQHQHHQHHIKRP